jgi:hypothetical protein
MSIDGVHMRAWADGHRPFMLHIYAALTDKESALTAIKAVSLQRRTGADAETA